MADAARIKPAREHAALSHPEQNFGAKEGWQLWQTYYTWFPGLGSRWALWGNPWGQGVAG